MAEISAVSSVVLRPIMAAVKRLKDASTSMHEVHARAGTAIAEAPERKGVDAPRVIRNWSNY